MSAFQALASVPGGPNRQHHHLFHQAFVGPGCDCLTDAQAALQNPQTAADFARQLDVVAPWVVQRCGDPERKDDASLPFRWAGIRAAIQYLLNGNVNHLAESAKQFDDAIQQLLGTGANYPSPGPSLFAQPRWTAGVFLVHDWLLALRPPTRNRPPKREATPILSVTEDAGGNYLGSVQKLVVEELEGPGGLILPDFFKLGLAAFPQAQGDNFVRTMHEAFGAGMQHDACSRLRWHIEPLQGDYPTSFSGRSAQVAAASCVLALADRERVGDDCTLEERTAVTACLGPVAAEPRDWLLDPHDLPRTALASPPSQKKLVAKFDAAARARLVAVLVCASQLPQTPHYSVQFPDGSRHTTLVQAVRTLEEAHDSLRVMSAAMRSYAKSVCEAWPWEEQETPDEYIQASNRNQR